MSPEFLASRPETGYAGGRAGWWGLDTANPLVRRDVRRRRGPPSTSP